MSRFLDEVRSAVGIVGLVDGDDVDRFTTDWSGKLKGREPLAVVRPASTAEVAQVVALCSRNGVAVVPQGGNTGLCGGSIPLLDGHGERGDCVVVSLSRMNRILSIDVDRATATAEAGVTIQALQEASAERGLLFAPDWGARGSAQIGGGISTNAGGLNVLRWGSMREQILGLEVVLPDGRIWNGLRSLRKDSTGFDVKQLFIGTEGTMGIVTSAVLRLHPRPSVHQTALVALASLDVLLEFFTHTQTNGRGLVSAFELVPDEGISRVLALKPSAQRPLEDRSDWYVLLRFSGGEEVAETMASVLSSASDAGLINDAALAVTPDQTENLWFLRDELPALTTFDARGNRHKFDMAIPVDRVVDFFTEAAPIVDAIVPGTLTYGFGHVGDGNLHFNIYPGPYANLTAFDEHGPAMERAIDELTWRYEGTISAEHGLGQQMVDRIAGQKSDIEFGLMRAVKSAIDPAGIMNPGKVLPAESG